MKELKTINILNIKETIATSLFECYTYPWEVLPHIKDFILNIGEHLSNEYRKELDSNNNPVWIHNTVNIGKFVTIEGPTIICKNTTLRHCSYIRENTIIGENCIIGNSSEIKNSIIFNNSQVPHFNYVGDSIMGFSSHIGAGVKLSNAKSDKSKIKISYNNEKIETNLKKFGAIIGDYSEIGCNSVTNPATIIGRNTTIYPCLSVRGYIKENMILKSMEPLVIIRKR